MSDFRPYGDHLGIELPGAQVVFTTRYGGLSVGPYRSLNLGRWTDDDPDAVQRNRVGLAAQLGVRFVWGRQVHGKRVVRVPDDQVAEGSGVIVDADGQATAAAGLAPMVLAADCLPIAITGGGAVAMVHAGWRGLAAGVVGEGAQAVRSLGAHGMLSAAIGPGAGPCCYEVGEEVHAVFARHGEGVRQGRNLDLKAIAARELALAGVADIHDCGICTMCSQDFFSHRRDHGVTGRQAGIAWLT